MPATTTMASASASSSTDASRRCTPATPQSATQLGAEAEGAEHGPALVGHREVGGAGGDDQDAPGAGRRGRQRTVASAPVG